MNDSLVNGTMEQRAAAVTYKGELQCPEYIDNGFIPEYSCDMARESAVLGVVSLLLTILNIICIIIMGIVVLKVSTEQIQSTLIGHIKIKLDYSYLLYVVGSQNAQLLTQKSKSSVSRLSSL